MSTTFAEYREAVDTAKTFRKEALARAEAYVSAGKSDLGEIDISKDGYNVDFSVEIGADTSRDGRENMVLVWVTNWANDDSLITYVPLEVIEGTAV